MSEYTLKGIYFFKGKENQFSGEVSVDEEGRIAGQITDPNSRCPKHDVEGRAMHLDGKVALEFLKRPAGKFFIGALAPIEYKLIKAGTGTDLSGNYTGGWRAANPERCGRLGIGLTEKGEEIALWIPEAELENKSLITLILKS